MVRSTEAEQIKWRRAASACGKSLGLAPGKLTIGPWARRVLNEAATRLLAP